MQVLLVGQRTATVYGDATILGFERYEDSGEQAADSAEDDGTQRVLVLLDAPENWVGSPLCGNPYFCRNEIKLLIG